MGEAAQPIAILIAALGGEGGGVLAEWLVEVATAEGCPAQSTSIPGVAQRTGATTYYVEIFPVRCAELGERRPVLSLLPVPGRVDLVVASELLEAVRIVQAGFVAPERTLLIASTSRTLTTAEKMAPGDGRYDAARLLALARRHSHRFVGFDMDELARAAGTVVSSVMCGAIAASRVLPFPCAAYERTIGASGLPAAASLDGFARAWAVMQDADAPAPVVPTAPAATPTPAADASVEVPVAVADALPAAVHDFAGEGYRRLVAFQDDAYAREYVARLQRMATVEAATEASPAPDFAVTRETARYLALWMAFDDVVYVAARKCRAQRFARVRREVRADADDVVRIYDFFKPGVPELAGLLPAAPARWLRAWDGRRVARGQPPLALALRLRSDGVAGLVALRLLASLRWLRRSGARFADEQEAIERWLAGIESALALDRASALEIALCGRLIKGYGATNERGKRNLRHILEHVAAKYAGAARADAIRQAREAALADEDGWQLDTTLARLDLPPRPIVAQPIRWMRR